MDDVTPVVLAIGTTHPLNIAGLGLDARIAQALGVRLVTIVAGISAQDGATVLARQAVNDSLLIAQFAALRSVPIAAIHIGALVDASSVRCIARALPSLRADHVVCDPVIAATGGHRLADDATVGALRDELFACCSLVTPNLDEAGLILEREIADVPAMERAATDLLATGAGAILLKGGHLAGDATDVLVERDRGGSHRFTGPRLTATLRGTGDLLACAIAARLAHGERLGRAIESARAFVRTCLLAGVDFAGTRTIP